MQFMAGMRSGNLSANIGLEKMQFSASFYLFLS
jgi:hypothetical protein